MPGFEPEPYLPCPCGSGEKYKFCCRDKHRAMKREAAFQSSEFNVARAQELHRQSLAFVEASRPAEAI
ncbi:MAG TPA: SEC-C metal-binding domain-containing protein, partial [Planctomycetota bacterium]|nr:SEC-C metal-binding domain-containing protein [Planctomycetota bacterium]